METVFITFRKKKDMLKLNVLVRSEIIEMRILLSAYH